METNCWWGSGQIDWFIETLVHSTAMLFTSTYFNMDKSQVYNTEFKKKNQVAGECVEDDVTYLKHKSPLDNTLYSFLIYTNVESTPLGRGIVLAIACSQGLTCSLCSHCS